SPAILETLRRFGVTAIELGAQSMSDRVLQLNHRGHTSLQVRFAALQIKNAGFSLGLQMMVGLFGETDPARFARDTALALASLEPDTMRIYPALVLQGTELAQLAAAGAYHPLSVEQAVAATAPLLQLFENKGIRVIRVGLHDEPSLAQQVVAGPYHPAFRQLCEASLYLDEMKSQLKNREEGAYTALVAPGQRSTGAGQKNENLTRLAQLGYAVTIVETAALCGRKVLIQNQKDVKACS
ncbi:MAG: radical SAM protein, partial [Pygmaiobacter sp.]